uniref:Calponin-homology (CH) domain-containing protein n=1 Tax=Arcella intermedia TaxID=1963864 RepID=A0A6B2LAV4_9EUKA
MESGSRGDLLAWINATLNINYTKIEDMANGAAYCVLFDVIHPGKIATSRVHLEAKQIYEVESNYKLLQLGFAKVGLNKEVPVKTLISGKYQGHLEFCQWFRKYYDTVNKPKPQETRKRDPPRRTTSNLTLNLPGPGPAAIPATPLRPPNPTFLLATPSNNTLTVQSTPASRAGMAPPSRPTTCKKPPPNVLTNIVNTRSHSDLEQSNLLLKEKISNMELSLNNTIKERNFYFHKLREIEILSDNFNQNVNAQDPKAKAQVEKSLVEQIRFILFGQVEDVPPEKLQDVAQLFNNFGNPSSSTPTST